MDDGVLLIARAMDFAARAHADQRRKGEAAEPYVNHLAEVARLVAEATQGGDPVLVAAALLHDSIEDVGVTAAQLEHAFGADVARVVEEVTDDKTLTKAERKRRQVATVAKKSARARMLKLADKTSNLRAIVASPPNWPLERKRAYVSWAREVAAGCFGLNAHLDAVFTAAADAADAALTGRPA